MTWQQVVDERGKSGNPIGENWWNGYNISRLGASKEQIVQYARSKGYALGDAWKSLGANTPVTIPGQLQGGALSGLGALAAANPGNEAVQGVVAGGIVDAALTQANTAQSIQYNDAYLASLSRYQQGLENLRLGNTQQLMGQEGAITERLQNQQIGGQKDIANIQAGTARYGYDTDLAGIQEQARTQRDVAGIEADSTRYTSDQQLRGVEAQAGASRYASQLGLEGVRSQADAQKYGAELESGSSRYASEMGLRGVEAQAGATRYAAGEQAGAQRYSAEQQAGAQKYGAELESGSSRYASELGLRGVESQAGAQRYTAEQQAGAQRYSAEQQAGAQRYGADAELRGTDLASGRQLEGTRYSADQQFKAADVTSGRQLEGTRYGYDSQERQIGLTGEQDRMSTTNKYARETESQIALRKDARGAIARAGSRFYG